MAYSLPMKHLCDHATYLDFVKKKIFVPVLVFLRILGSNFIVLTQCTRLS